MESKKAIGKDVLVLKPANESSFDTSSAVKKDSDDDIERFKGRLVAKSYA